MKVKGRFFILFKWLSLLFLSFMLLLSFFSCSDGGSKSSDSSSSSSSETYHLTNETLSKIMEGTLYIEETSGVTKNTEQHYSVSSKIESLLFRYNGEISYSPLTVVFKRFGTVIKTDSFSSKSFYRLDIKGLPVGTYSVTFYGKYKSYTYSYPITIVIEDPDD